MSHFATHKDALDEKYPVSIWRQYARRVSPKHCYANLLALVMQILLVDQFPTQLAAHFNFSHGNARARLARLGLPGCLAELVPPAWAGFCVFVGGGGEWRDISFNDDEIDLLSADRRQTDSFSPHALVAIIIILLSPSFHQQRCFVVLRYYLWTVLLSNWKWCKISYLNPAFSLFLSSSNVCRNLRGYK